MKTTSIGGALFKDMVLSGALMLARKKNELNDLNVFPVPDGDTGTNMLLTIKGAVKEISAVESDSISAVGEALSRGSLKGARGNSGVILSQIFRGFYQSIQGKEQINSKEFAQAMKSSVATAYRAVMKPREGTILTVSKACAEGAEKAAQGADDILEIMEQALSDGDDMLERTPDMLDVLKQAGVVDAGGAGLLVIYRGYLSALRGEAPAGSLDEIIEASSASEEAKSAAGLSEQDIEFGYCTEFFITNLNDGVNDDDVNRLKNRLQLIGDSMVVVNDVDIVKVHVHSNMPGKVLQYALRLGSLSDIKIDNMREQHSHLHEYDEPAPAKKERTQSEVVCVAAGDGLEAVFKDLGAAFMVQGGQTMNPSTEDILAAIEAANADNVIVLPNNSNIIMAAQQAAEIAECEVRVIPTKTVPQGVAAMLGYEPSNDIDTNSSSMEGMIEGVLTGQVTYAVRDSSFDGKEIKEGDIMGISNGTIEVVGNDIYKCTLELVNSMMHEDAEIVTFYYGEDTKKEDAEKIAEELSEKYADADFEVYYGGQPLYYYIISVE